MKRHLGHLALYGSSTALLALAALMLIPAMIRASGPEVWGAIATGQAIGLIVATVINFGWPYVGPSKVASIADAERSVEILLSAIVRIGLMPLSLVLGLLVTAIVVHGSTAAGLCGVAMSAPLGLSYNWYFVGMRQPGLLLAWDTLPRFMASVLAVVAMITGEVGAMGGALIVGTGTLISALVSFAHLARVNGLTHMAPAQDWRNEVKSRAGGLGSALASNGLSAMPIVLLNLVSPASVPTYALIERPFRQLLSGLGIVVNFVQGALADTRNSRMIGRIQMVSRVVVFSLPGQICLLVPVAWLVLGAISAGEPLPAWAPIAVAALTALHFAENVLGRAALPPLNELSYLARLTIVNGALTMTVFVILAIPFGALGAVCALAGGAVVRVCLQLTRVLAAGP